MRAGLRKALLGTALGAVFLYAAGAAQAESPKWGPHLDIEGRWGEGRSLGDVGIFAPLWQSPTSLFFTDVRLKYDNRDSMEGNFGLGLRHMLSSGWNLGAYGYFDRRRSGTGRYFNQATLGVEALSADWDLRANAYVPFGERTKDLGLFGGGAPFAVLANGTIQVVSTPGLARRYERSLTGADAEIGWRLPVFPGESLAQLRAYAGGYWFDGGGLVNDIYGPRGRLELSFDDALGVRGARFTLGGEVQHDRLRGTQAYAVARLRIPLQAPGRSRPHLTAQEARMTERVVRDVDVVTGGHETVLVEEVREAAINRYNSQTVTGAVQINAASGQTALQTALDNHGAGGVVILNGGLTGLTTSTSLSTNGTLLGGGAVLPVEGAISGTQVNFVAPGAAGSLSGAVGTGTQNAVIRFAADSVVGGLTVTNTSTANSSQGIWGDNVSNATVFGNTITTTSGSGAAGIVFNGGNNGTASGNVIVTQGSNSPGIVFNASDNGTASGNEIATQGNDAYGIFFANGSDNGMASGNVIATQGGNAHGILFLNLSANGRASGNQITTQGSSAHGFFWQVSHNGVANGNQIATQGSGAHGFFWAGSNNGTASNNQIATQGSNAHGFLWQNGNIGNLISNQIAATGTGARGVAVSNSTNMTVFGNAFGAIGGAVISADSTTQFVPLGSGNNTWTGAGGGVLCSFALGVNGSVPFTNTGTWIGSSSCP